MRKTNIERKNAVIYPRVSSKEQKDNGNSLDIQRKRLEEYCKHNNINVLKVFSEDCSAKNFNRPQFKSLEEYVKQNAQKIDYILVQKWDRFSRNLGLAILKIEKFKKKKIEVNSINNWIDYDVPDHIVMLSIALSTPQAENTKIGERSVAGTMEALSKGRYCKAIPKGYLKGVGIDKRPLMKVDESNYKLVKALFEDYSTGLYSQKELIKKYSNRGLKLSKSGISRMLDNPLYMGMVRVPAYRGEPKKLVEGLHEAIISKETFYISQRIKNGKKAFVKNNSTKNNSFPLSGFLIYSECGKKMYGSQSNNGKKKKVTRTYNYYHCNNSVHQNNRYRAELIHEELINVLKSIKPCKEVIELFELILIDEYKKVRNDRVKDENAIENKINEVNRKQLTATEKYSMGNIKDELYSKLIEGYDNELIELLAEKSEIADFQDDLDKFISFSLTLISNLDTLFNQASIETKVKLLGSVFSEKLVFSENGFRTLPFNEAILLISRYNKAFEKLSKKKGGIQKNVSHNGSIRGLGSNSDESLVKLDFERILHVANNPFL